MLRTLFSLIHNSLIDFHFIDCSLTLSSFLHNPLMLNINLAICVYMCYAIKFNLYINAKFLINKFLKFLVNFLFKKNIRTTMCKVYCHFVIRNTNSRTIQCTVYACKSATDFLHKSKIAGIAKKR